ncbi:MAG: PaaI family thioesterase [Leptospirales bacterium]|nr:PaaI family thioesterase [Leptospirales bacterium]
MYLKAPVNEYFRLAVEIRHSEAHIRIPVRTDFFHAGGAVHGHVYFKALDDAAFFAANSLVEDVFVLTAVFEIRFLKPVSSGQLHAIGSVVSASKRVFVCESRLLNSENEVIATGSGKFMRSAIPLTPEIGYA